MTTRKTTPPDANSQPQSALQQRLEALNQAKIDLGLSRLKQVIQNLAWPALPTVITVAGTNGKGSTVAALSSLLSAQQRTWGAFTSPHIHRFNERININGQLASDAEILAAFDAIDAASGDIQLSYFEYNFLAAVMIFLQHGVEFMLLEVGLGGRLDATNALDADACIITTVDWDHMAWLGDDLAQIGREKAGVMRSGRPAVLAAADLPASVEQVATELAVPLWRVNQEYQVEIHADSFDYRQPAVMFEGLPHPQLPGRWQIHNFSAALTALLALGLEFDPSQVRQALQQVSLPGRLQTMQHQPTVVADVAHNQQSAEALASWLREQPGDGQTRAVFSVLDDKMAEQWLPQFADLVDHWLVFQLSGPRATPLPALKVMLADSQSLISVFDSGPAALHMARQLSAAHDRVVVFGSFHVLDEVFSA
ncbi:bifunctional folylpolyglutamate synthase/dihydrofolate synthase [Marinicella meishanensis]|uniref:bifunctional folylpolyglutamate synthase/dihydrofolate synthase n=1 Tax=Marinicella meishanensis TaxID=2873263 RepID=UPI001CC0184F|nr:folylpolyglutamate synthase/dihydrofolate synthase family protein [Marinicella sp. NBU2979]